MSNRAWLYLLDDTGRAIQVAETSDVIPSLWRVILSDSQAGEAFAYQRVFGDAKTPGLLGDARVARFRLGALVQFLQAHPLPGDAADLPRALDLLVNWLDHEIETMGGATPVFSADLDELYWLEGDDDSEEDPEDPARYIEHERWICHAVWAAIDRRMAASDVRGVRMALGLTDSATGAEWMRIFGFDGLSHDAIQEALQENTDTRIGGDDAGPGPREWRREDGRCGLVDAQERWMIAPAFDNVVDLADIGLMGLALVQLRRRWGLKTHGDEWVVPVEWRELAWYPECHAFIAERKGRQGLIDCRGRMLVEPIYAEVTAFGNDKVMKALRAQSIERFVVKNDAGSAMVIDGDGHLLTPSDGYTDIAAFDWFAGEGPVPVATVARYVRAVLSDEENAAVAIFDIDKQVEVVRGDYIWTYALCWGSGYGWFVVEQGEDGNYQAGVIDANGKVIHPPCYWWMGSFASFSSDEADHLIPYEMTACWRRGEPVSAMHKDGQLRWLYADGRSEHCTNAT